MSHISLTDYHRFISLHPYIHQKFPSCSSSRCSRDDHSATNNKIYFQSQRQVYFLNLILLALQQLITPSMASALHYKCLQSSLDQSQQTINIWALLLKEWLPLTEMRRLLWFSVLQNEIYFSLLHITIPIKDLRVSTVVEDLLTHPSIQINVVHCDVNYLLVFEFSDEWLRVQVFWMMCRAFLMVAHNFTDQWTLSKAVKRKRIVEFVMRPNSIFHSHCSARTRPFESHSAAK